MSLPLDPCIFAGGDAYRQRRHSGFLIILAEVVTLSAFRVWEEWINVVLGLWLVGSPWFLDIASSAARIEFIVVGILVVALAFYEMKQSRRFQGSHK